MATINAVNNASAPFGCTGSVTVTSGNLLLPTSSSSVGQIQINSTCVLHNYGTNNTFVGESCGNFTLYASSATQGGSNTFVGYNNATALVGTSATQATSNTGVGTGVMVACTDGSYNSACGSDCLNTLTTGNYNSALGYRAGYSSITDGSYNIFIGAQTGTDYAGSESSNILIGVNVAGTASENNVLRIGTATGTGTGGLNAAYVCGIYNINADSGGTPHAVYIGSGNKLGKNPSSKKFKENIVDIKGSEKIYELRPVNFNYIGNKAKQWGLIAEEVAPVIPELAGYDSETGEPDSVFYERLPVLLLAELKKLRSKLDDIKIKVETGDLR